MQFVCSLVRQELCLSTSSERLKGSEICVPRTTRPIEVDVSLWEFVLRFLLRELAAFLL